MNRKLKDYIDQLFAQVSDSTYARELKEEMLINLNDRYEDLLIEGKSKEEAFIIVTSSIGDIRELLSGLDETAVIITTKDIEKRRKESALIRSIAIMLYIISPAMLIALSIFNMPVLGVVVLLIIVAGATGLLVYDNVSKPENLKDEYAESKRKESLTAEQRKKENIKEAIQAIFWLLVVGIYLLMSFMLDIWAYSWVIFIIAAAINKVIDLLFELKE
ncbi:permease prefix domain 1-containing protein [Niameybacter massiliensis]|uniref:Permease prefix domain 1-containing protein n=1 Tax=Holtiella tumoricola TaxID=3018743 RepID=A0AA42DRZ8_9FIRM|nr:permease prefix domain 1-containing protein [Holtiella tumoricola]MDA3734265.1 permease prefix domain 1-containing protein [Holtiella tumoricola]